MCINLQRGWVLHSGREGHQLIIAVFLIFIYCTEPLDLDDMVCLLDSPVDVSIINEHSISRGSLKSSMLSCDPPNADDIAIRTCSDSSMYLLYFSNSSLADAPGSPRSSADVLVGCRSMTPMLNGSGSPADPRNRYQSTQAIPSTMTHVSKTCRMLSRRIDTGPEVLERTSARRPLGLP